MADYKDLEHEARLHKLRQYGHDDRSIDYILNSEKEREANIISNTSSGYARDAISKKLIPHDTKYDRRTKSIQSTQHVIAAGEDYEGNPTYVRTKAQKGNRSRININQRLEGETQSFIPPPPKYYFMDLDLELADPHGVSYPPSEYKLMDGTKVFHEYGDQIPYIKQVLVNNMVKPMRVKGLKDLDVDGNEIIDVGTRGLYEFDDPRHPHEISAVINASRYNESRDTVQRIVDNQTIEEFDDEGMRYRVLPEGSIIPGINMFSLEYKKGNKIIKTVPLVIPYRRYDGTTFIDKQTGRSINDLITRKINSSLVQFIKNDDASKDIYKKLRSIRGTEGSRERAAWDAWREHYQFDGRLRKPSDFWDKPGKEHTTPAYVPSTYVPGTLPYIEDMEERKRRANRAKITRKSKPVKKAAKTKYVKKNKPIKKVSKKRAIIKKKLVKKNPKINYAVMGNNMIAKALTLMGGKPRRI